MKANTLYSYDNKAIVCIQKRIKYIYLYIFPLEILIFILIESPFIISKEI